MKIYKINPYKVGGGIAFLLFALITLFTGIFVNNSKNILEIKRVYAEASEYDAEPYVEGEITSIEVNVDYSKTNEYGVAGIFTSMNEQDLIDGEYLSLTVNYSSGESEAITSGYTLSMNSEIFFEGNVNEVTLTYNDFSTVFMINATAVYLQQLEINTSSLDEVDIFESYLVNDLNQYIEVTGVNKNPRVKPVVFQVRVKPFVLADA